MGQSAYSINENVADGEFVSVDIPLYFERGYFSLTFFDSSNNFVKPTAGSATVTVSDDGFNYGSITNGEIADLTKDYDRPNYAGSVRKFKISLSGVTGADKFSLRLSVYS